MQLNPQLQRITYMYVPVAIHWSKQTNVQYVVVKQFKYFMIYEHVHDTHIYVLIGLSCN